MRLDDSTPYSRQDSIRSTKLRSGEVGPIKVGLYVISAIRPAERSMLRPEFKCLHELAAGDPW